MRICFWFVWVWLGLWSGTVAAGPAAPDDGASQMLLDEPPAGDPPSPAETKRRAAELGAQLRCPVCQALSVADSKADAAVAMAGRIEELVSLGYSDEQIIEYFVGRYGEWVRLEPKAEGIHLLIFVAPAVVLFVGLLVVRARLKKGGPAPSGAPSSGSAPSGAPPDDPYRQRVLAELAELDAGGSS